MTVFTDVEGVIQPFNLPYGYDVLLTATDDPLPDEFFTYKLISDVPVQFADNTDKEHREHVQISYLNKAGVNSQPDIKGAMKAAGWIWTGTVEIPRDETTGHFGLAFDFVR